LYAMEVQLQEGHSWIRNNLGDQYIPKYGWSIDPFGYSPTMAYLLRKYDFEGMLIQRVHYAVKKELASKQQLEFLWR
jgi:alpha-mannosidase II